eukprot:TRINITY_DN11925_c0_g1_i2.p2 TRINITY_DN11925_c0_g1~~TRINITY_DN11925_c0_g1_i2.p2  ORF type:complete len:836 (+),score=200.21 TRINITY_DN11925_c0_g1_i2:12-2519(+)
MADILRWIGATAAKAATSSTLYLGGDSLKTKIEDLFKKFAVLGEPLQIEINEVGDGVSAVATDVKLEPETRRLLWELTGFAFKDATIAHLVMDLALFTTSNKKSTITIDGVILQLTTDEYKEWKQWQADNPSLKAEKTADTKSWGSTQLTNMLLATAGTLEVTVNNLQIELLENTREDSPSPYRGRLALSLTKMTFFNSLNEHGDHDSLDLEHISMELNTYGLAMEAGESHDPMVRLMRDEIQHKLIEEQMHMNPDVQVKFQLHEMKRFAAELRFKSVQILMAPAKSPETGERNPLVRIAGLSSQLEEGDYLLVVELANILHSHDPRPVSHVTNMPASLRKVFKMSVKASIKALEFYAIQSPLEEVVKHILGNRPKDTDEGRRTESPTLTSTDGFRASLAQLAETGSTESTAALELETVALDSEPFGSLCSKPYDSKLGIGKFGVHHPTRDIDQKRELAQAIGCESEDADLSGVSNKTRTCYVAHQDLKEAVLVLVMEDSCKIESVELCNPFGVVIDDAAENSDIEDIQTTDVRFEVSNSHKGPWTPALIVSSDHSELLDEPQASVALGRCGPQVFYFEALHSCTYVRCTLTCSLTTDCNVGLYYIAFRGTLAHQNNDLGIMCQIESPVFLVPSKQPEHATTECVVFKPGNLQVDNHGSFLKDLDVKEARVVKHKHALTLTARDAEMTLPILRWQEDGGQWRLAEHGKTPKMLYMLPPPGQSGDHVALYTQLAFGANQTTVRTMVSPKGCTLVVMLDTEQLANLQIVLNSFSKSTIKSGLDRLEAALEAEDSNSLKFEVLHSVRFVFKSTFWVAATIAYPVQVVLKEAIAEVFPS